MASNRLATFAPNEVDVIITQSSSGLNHVVSGFAEDKLVGVERAAETFSKYVGADNTTTRIYKADKSLSITLSLQQTSNSNDIMMQLYKNDVATRNGLFSILVKDNSGRSYYFAEEAYIAVVPSTSYANSMQVFEWVIHAHDSDVYIGGNAPFSAEDQSAMEALGATIAPQWQA